MIGWRSPAAFIGLIALAGPVVVHLLRRRQATRIAFPTVRFIDPSITGAVRLRPPADVKLMLVRLGIIGIAVCALAQPVLLTRARLDGWNTRVSRAIVLDRSESMAAAAGPASQTADAESRTAYEATLVETADLEDGIRRAVARLSSAPPARREVVVVSDFQAGAIDRTVIDRVPPGIGLRFVRVGDAPARRQVTGISFIHAAGRSGSHAIALDGASTAATAIQRLDRIEGLRLDGTTADATTSLLEIVASSGAPAPSPAEPIVVTFSTRGESPASPLRGWMIDVVLRLMADEEVRRAAETASSLGEPADPWIIVARNSAGAPVVRAAAVADSLALHVADRADSYVAAATVRGALWARGREDVRRLGEQEVLRIPDSQLSAWMREAARVDADVWSHAADTDARWFWVAALVLIAFETVLRRR